MSSKKEWKAAAERRLAENVAMRILLHELEEILTRPIGELAQAKRCIRRALRKIAVAKEVK